MQLAYPHKTGKLPSALQIFLSQTPPTVYHQPAEYVNTGGNLFETSLSEEQEELTVSSLNEDVPVSTTVIQGIYI